MNSMSWAPLSSVLANVIASRKSEGSEREIHSWFSSCQAAVWLLAPIPLTELQFFLVAYFLQPQVIADSNNHSDLMVRPCFASWYLSGSLDFAAPLKEVSSLNCLHLPFWLFHVFPAGILTDILMCAPFQYKHQSLRYPVLLSMVLKASGNQCIKVLATLCLQLIKLLREGLILPGSHQSWL